ncbi:MAG: S-layer homology domain-containing protein, partial [Chloroflexia bacterium]
SYNESTDGGATWSATQRVSDTSSDPDRLIDIKGIDDIGIRKSLVYGPDYALPSWVDTRLGVQQGEFFVDHGAVPTTTPTPTILTPTSVPTSTPTVCTLQFEDVPNGSTFYPFVQCLACRGILTGYPCGGTGEPCVGPGNYPYFRPASTITRGQLAKVVSNSAGFSDPIATQAFEDVPSGSTFYDFIGRLVLHGVMNGYPCGNPEPCVPPANLPYFRPNNDATRGQISKIVALAAGLNNPPGTRIFEDVIEGSTFYTFTQQLANLGVMSGYPCGNPEPCVPPGNRPYFRPNNNATRGQVSKIVSNTFFPSCSTAR